MSTEQITQALSEMRQLREKVGRETKWLSEPDRNYGQGDDFINANVHNESDVICDTFERSGKNDIGEFIAQAANNWMTLITCLEKACATLKKECCCPGEVSWTTGKDILCEPCETLTEISEMLGQGIG